MRTHLSRRVELERLARRVDAERFEQDTFRLMVLTVLDAAEAVLDRESFDRLLEALEGLGNETPRSERRKLI